MKINYLEFDYDDKEKINSTIENIKKEIDKYLENPIIGYTDKYYSSGISMQLSTKSNRIFKASIINQDGYVEPNIIDETKLNRKGYISELQDVLHQVEQHLKPVRPDIEIFGIKKYSETKKEADKYDDLAKKNGLFAKEKIEEIKSYLSFVLAVINDLEHEKQNINIIESLSSKTLEQQNKYNEKISELHAIRENLEDIRYKLEKIKQDLFDFRGLQDLDPRRTINESTVQYDVVYAKSLIEKFKKKISVKEKRQNLFNSCEQRYVLREDNEIIDKLLERLRVEREQDFNNDIFKNEEKINKFINKVRNGALYAGSISAHEFIYEEKLGNIFASFFGFENYTIDEKISRLEILRLAVISTEQELQDYMTKGNKDILLTRTADGKLNITIAHKLSFEEEMRIKKSGATEEKSYLNNKSEITYLYDLHKKELEAVSYKDNMSLYNIDINSTFGTHIKNQFSSFIGALEGSLNVKEKSLLGFRLSLPENLNLFIRGAGIKNKIEAQTGNITTKLEVGGTAAEVGLSKRRGIKIKLVDATGKANLETDISNLEFKINTYTNDNLENTTRITAKNFVLALQKDKVQGLFGTELTSIFGVQYNKEQNKLGIKGLLEEIGKGGKTVFEIIQALFYSHILGDKDKAMQILGSENVSDREMVLIFDKIKQKISDIKYVKRDFTAYKRNKTINEFKNQNANFKDAKIIEKVIDTMGNSKDVKVESFNSVTQIENADKLTDDELFDNNIKTYKRTLESILETSILVEDLPILREGLLKSKNPLTYFDKIDRVQADSNETRKSVLNIYNKVCENYLLKLIENKDKEKLKDIIKNPKYKKIAVKTFNKINKKDLKYLLIEFKNEQSETIDELIAKNKRVAQKVLSSNTENKSR